MSWRSGLRDMITAAMVLLVAIFIPLSIGGCSKGMIRADAVSPLTEDVTIRHDKLLRGELKPESISDADKATYLRSSELLRKTIKEARAP